MGWQRSLTLSSKAVSKTHHFGDGFFFVSFSSVYDQHAVGFSISYGIKKTASVIVSPPVIASDSEATQCSVPRTLGCFAIARNDGSSVSGETMTMAKKIQLIRL